MAHHVWQNVLPTTAIVGGAAWMDLRLGVVFFFCLTGYLLCGPWVRASLDRSLPRPALGRYVRHRATRILPLYWLALLVSAAILHGSGSFREVSDRRLLVFAGFGQNWFGALAGRLDPPMWTLTVEVAFYAVLPVVGTLALRASRSGSHPRPAPRSGGARRRARTARGLLSWRLVEQPVLAAVTRVECARRPSRARRAGRPIRTRRPARIPAL